MLEVTDALRPRNQGRFRLEGGRLSPLLTEGSLDAATSSRSGT